jgi:hypothetical protein
MIKGDLELQRTREALVLIENALQSLRDDVFDKSPARFRMMAEGYVDEIDMLRARIDEYIGLKAARETSDVLIHQ